MSKKVHISTLSNEELKLLIIKIVTRQKFSKQLMTLLLDSYFLLNVVINGLTSRKEVIRDLVIRNISHISGHYFIRPLEDK